MQKHLMGRKELDFAKNNQSYSNCSVNNTLAEKRTNSIVQGNSEISHTSPTLEQQTLVGEVE